MARSRARRILRASALGIAAVVVAATVAHLLLGDRPGGLIGLLHAAAMEETPPRAPDYAEPSSWAALPGRLDGADAIFVPGAVDRQANARADVFYLHAAANWTLHWNAPIHHPIVERIVNSPGMDQFASVFNGCCRVYSPRFRQEPFLQPRHMMERREQAIDLAYQDVRAAFLHYLEHENQGRPFIVAGSNSGGRHALRLLIEEVAGRPLRQRLVTAYLVNTRVDREARAALGDIGICDGPEESGCVNTWSLVGRQRWGSLDPLPHVACVNPLSWRSNDERVPREANRGGIQIQYTSGEPPSFDPGLTDAQCHEGRLWASAPETGRDYFQPYGPGDYHIQNFSFYYVNIRENATERVDAFVPGEPAPPLANAGATWVRPPPWACSADFDRVREREHEPRGPRPPRT